MHHDINDLITLFEQAFYNRFNTKLVKGADEPVYLPSNDICSYHQVVFAHGYYASALHEIAHWCMAGEARRLLEDFGYWYVPDGRNEEQQKVFEQVEIKPQALEWAFCIAANKPFNVSADNLSGAQADTIAFKSAVYQQVKDYLVVGFPIRAHQFISILAAFYKVDFPLCIEHFNLDKERATCLS
jgi:elongation factor P hydroxylase